MRIIGKILRSFTLGVYVLCGLALLVFVAPATGLKAKAVATGSMRPHIPPGSLVITHTIPWQRLRVGDVVNYQSLANRKVTITHRIVAEKKIGNAPYFTTKGDANKVSDPEIVGGQILGKVVMHVPYVGYALLNAKNPWVILPIVYLAALPILIEEVKRLNDYYKLSQPYRILGFERVEQQASALNKKLTLGVLLTFTFIVVGAAAGPSALAMLKTNTVVLAHNRLSVATGNQNNCSGTTSNNTNINVNNSSTQTATSGNATVSGDTNGGSATSGSASNSNSTTVNVTINNCH
jgi:signal peptidase I